MPPQYIYGTSGGMAGAPVYNTTYGQYYSYGTPQVIGTPIYNNGASAPKSQSTTTASSGPTSTAESWLNDVLGGKNLPFSPFTQSQMLSQQSDMSAAAESAQNQQLSNQAAMGNTSASDPSMQSAKASNMAHRQTANQTAARDISSAAAQKNFGAQMDAAGALNQNQMQREAWQHQNDQGASVGMPYSPFGSGRGGGGYGSTPSQTVGMGLYGGNPYTNAADPSGNGEPWSRPLGFHPDSYYTNMGL